MQDKLAFTIKSHRHINIICFFNLFCCWSILLIICSTLSSIPLQHTSQSLLFINTSSSVILFICSLLLNNLCTLVTVKSSGSAQQSLLCSSTMLTLPINTAAQFQSIYKASHVNDLWLSAIRVVLYSFTVAALSTVCSCPNASLLL